MIRFTITNHTDEARTWQVEPYGDVVTIAGQDTLLIEIPHSEDHLVEVSIHPDLTQIWMPILPTELKLNGATLWPDANHIEQSASTEAEPKPGASRRHLTRGWHRFLRH